MLKNALPILGVSKSAVAEAFYCGQLGFRRLYAYRPHSGETDPGWLGVIRDDAHVVLSSFECDGPPGTRAVQIYVDDAAALQCEFRQAGVAVPDELTDEPYGNLEFTFVDPDGNKIIISQEK